MRLRTFVMGITSKQTLRGKEPLRTIDLPSTNQRLSIFNVNAPEHWRERMTYKSLPKKSTEARVASRSIVPGYDTSSTTGFIRTMHHDLSAFFCTTLPDGEESLKCVACTTGSARIEASA